MAELNGTSLKSLSTLKAYYRFESGALTTDDSGNSNTLTAISAPAEGTGKYGGCATFTTDDAYSIVSSSSLKPTAAMTLAYWIKVANGYNTTSVVFQSYKYASSKISGFYSAIMDTGKIFFRVAAGTGEADGTDYKQAQSTTLVNNGNWHHVVCTFDSANLKIYIDGVLDITPVAFSPDIGYDGTPLHRIACVNMESSNGDFLTGSLDDVALWNGTVLTADQVSVLYSNSVRTVTLNPTGDNFLYSPVPTANYGTNTFLFAGELKGVSGDVRRTLIRFDLSTRSLVDTIKSAVIRLYDEAGDYSDNARLMSAYRVLRVWTETESTWNVYSTGNSWGTAGCANTSTDREASSVGSITMPATEVAQYYGFDLMADKVQDWIDGDLTNNGILLQMATESDDTHQFESRENTYKPELIIDYEPGVTTNHLKHYAGKRALE